MGHAYGLDHSRQGDVDQPLKDDKFDYMDPWDVMSYNNTFNSPDADFNSRGVGLNAWNQRGRGWLDESRVWRSTSYPYAEVVVLRPLDGHDLLGNDLPGFLCAEIATNRTTGPLLVEFRTTERWDAGIPKPVVLVHRFSHNQSYLLSGSTGRPDLGVGDIFERDILYDDQTQYVHIEIAVRAIDVAGGTATVFLKSELFRPPPIKDRDNP